MPEISRFNLQISVVMFENSGTILSFWGRLLWFESMILLATGSSGWTVAKSNVFKMESALFRYFSHLDC